MIRYFELTLVVRYSQQLFMITVLLHSYVGVLKFPFFDDFCPSLIHAIGTQVLSTSNCFLLFQTSLPELDTPISKRIKQIMDAIQDRNPRHLKVRNVLLEFSVFQGAKNELVLDLRLRRSRSHRITPVSQLVSQLVSWLVITFTQKRL